MKRMDGRASKRTTERWNKRANERASRRMNEQVNQLITLPLFLFLVLKSSWLAWMDL